MFPKTQDLLHSKTNMLFLIDINVEYYSVVFNPFPCVVVKLAHLKLSLLGFV